jgi:hypothetical protein
VKFLLQIRGFGVFFVIGTSYNIVDNTIQTSCLRIMWNGELVLRCGPKPRAIGAA